VKPIGQGFQFLRGKNVAILLIRRRIGGATIASGLTVDGSIVMRYIRAINLRNSNLQIKQYANTETRVEYLTMLKRILLRNRYEFVSYVVRDCFDERYCLCSGAAAHCVEWNKVK
jgi:hypothetical protein